jgi:eukaryotic-like serine/threonine-protein kinase
MQRTQPQASTFVVGGRYEIKEAPIGQGGMGVVYKAYDTVTRRYVALKTIWGGVNSMALALFEKEWSVLARLSHPNIVDIIETGQFEDAGGKKPFFVMPLLPGVTLDQLIKKASQRLTVERTVDIMSQACRGLQAAHDQGLVHRDLKPSNIFVMDDDSVKLIDFGVVHLTDMNTMTGMKGTLNYIAPELLDRKPPSILSDVFALGVVCYEAFTRRKPFERPSEDETVEAIRSYIPPPVSDINSAVNEPLSRTVHKSMAKQPWHRFSSAREFGDILKKALRSEPIEYFDPAKIQPRIERVKRAQGEGDYQFAKEILSELEAEGHIDLQISLLRMQLDQTIKQKTIRQLMESARTRVEEEEYPLALQKIQEVLEIDPQNSDALHLRTQIEKHRNEKQIDNWYRLVQQHIDNQMFSQARMGLEEILRINPIDARAHSLLDQVDRQEKEANKVREEKEQLYQSALKCYQCGEVSTALDKLERLLSISRQSTRTPNPEKDAQYQGLYNQIRSDREAFRNGYAEARRCLEDRNFSKAKALCQEFLGKNASDPMFQALKLEVDERERQERSAAVADVDRRVETEADLDRKINILKEAMESYPNEAHFKDALKLVRGRRDLLDSIVNRAKQYEQNSQFYEAAGQWDILRNIYPQYPGLDAEVQRLRLKREGQLHEESKSRWVRQIDQYLEAGEYEKAQAAVREALAEFPGDLELASLSKLATQGSEKQQEAQQYFTEAQALLAGSSAPEAIDLFRKAASIDARDRTIRGAFLGALLERAKTLLNEDWRGAQALVQEALKLDGSNPVGRSLFSQVQDRERQALVDTCVLEARELQASGDFQGALNKVREAQAQHPRESRLTQLESTLLNNLGHQSRSRAPEKPAAQTPQRNRRLSADSIQESDEQPSGAGTAPALQQAQASNVKVARPVAREKQTPQGPSLAQKMSAALGKIKLSGRTLVIVAAIPVLLIGAVVGIKVMKSRPQPQAAAGSTELQANVPEVKFFLDGQPTESPVVLSPGEEHVLEASHEGYDSSVQKITPEAGKQLGALNFTLSPLLPHLQVQSDVQGVTVSVGDQPAAALQDGIFDVNQLATGQQIVKIFSGSKQIVELPLTVEPGKAVTFTGQVDTKSHSVAVASILGTHAKVFASTDLKGNVSGQELQALPPAGMDVDTKASSSIFTLSNSQTLSLDPTNRPMVIISVTEHPGSAADGAAPVATARKTPAHLVLSSMPDDSLILIDSESPRPVSGTVQLTLAPGAHKIVLRRPHFEDSPAITVMVKAGQPVPVEASRFQLQPQGALLFKINPPTATVTYQLNEPQQSPHKANAGDTVWVKPGKYHLKIEAQGYAPEETDSEAKAGAQPAEIKKNLKVVAAEAPAPATPTPSAGDPVEDAKLWTRNGNWWEFKKDGFGWLKYKQGAFNVTIQKPKKGWLKTTKKVEWTIDYRDDGNKVICWIDDNTYHRITYKDGKAFLEGQKVMSKHPTDYKLTFDVSSRHISVNEADNGKLDDFDRPNSNAPLGKIGFKAGVEVMVQSH